LQKEAMKTKMTFYLQLPHITTTINVTSNLSKTTIAEFMLRVWMKVVRFNLVST
jgi:hypothetical protein